MRDGAVEITTAAQNIPGGVEAILPTLDILFLCYEDMTLDLPGAVRRIAAFLGLDSRSEAIEVATRQASLEFMRRQSRQFDDHLLREARDEACGLVSGGDSAKVREGRPGEHAQSLSEADSRLLDEVWRQEVERRIGMPTYDALREALARK